MSITQRLKRLEGLGRSDRPLPFPATQAERDARLCYLARKVASGGGELGATVAPLLERFAERCGVDLETLPEFPPLQVTYLGPEPSDDELSAMLVRTLAEAA